MDSTIEHARQEQLEVSKPRRRPQRAGCEVVAAVEKLAAHGLKRPEIALILGMDGRPHGSIRMALKRHGRPDLIRAIALPASAPKSSFSPDRVRELADRFLATARPEDLAVVFGRRRLLVEDVTPPGRPVRGPGGIVRWVAA